MYLPGTLCSGEACANSECIGTTLGANVLQGPAETMLYRTESRTGRRGASGYRSGPEPWILNLLQAAALRVWRL